MNNEQTQPTTPQTPQSAPVDQQALDLTHAIALEESGGQSGAPNYEAVGDNGTSTGAYQWQPGNFQSEAEQYGLDPDDFSPQNQDKVAYSRVEALKNQGYTPGQIAAGWNAGMGKVIDGSWVNNKGSTTINGKQIAYDTPTYVQGVQQKYDQLIGQSGASQSSSTPSTPVTPPTSGLSTWEKVALGVAGVGAGLGLTFATGGLDVAGGLLGLGAEGAADAGAGALGEGAADVAGGAAADATGTGAADTAGAAAEQPGVISKIMGAAKSVAQNPIVEGIGTGVGTYETAKNILGGGTPPTGGTGTPPPQNAGTPPSTPPEFTDQSFTQSHNASQALFNAQRTAMETTATGRVALQSPDIQQGMNANATYGIIPSVDENGNYDSQNALKQADEMIGGLSEGISQSLEAEGNHGNIDSAVADAKAEMRRYTPSYDWDSADAEIDRQAESYKKNFGGAQISLGNMERMRKEQGNASRFDITNPITPAKRSAHKSLYFATRREIEKNTEDKHLYNAAMKEEQGLINGKKINKRLNGKKAHKEQTLGRLFAEKAAQAASVYIGDKIGGPLGAVVGAVVGQKLERQIDKKFGANILDTKSVKKALELVAQKKPAVAQLIQDAINKYGNRQAAEKEYKVIQKEEPKKEQVTQEKEMGTYQLGKNKSTGRVGLTGFFKKPGVVMGGTMEEGVSPFTRRKNKNTKNK